MACSMLLSDLLLKNNDTINSVFLSGFIILMINPLAIFDIGFVLSFGGTIGIILFNKKITYLLTKHFNKNNNCFVSFLIELFSVSTSAQIVLTPIMMYYFNQISIYSIIVNIIISPLVPFITILRYLLSIYILY
jgi:competence protein ComEC